MGLIPYSCRKRHQRHGRPDHRDHACRRNAGTYPRKRRTGLHSERNDPQDKRQERSRTKHCRTGLSRQPLYSKQYDCNHHYRRNSERHHKTLRTGPTQERQHPGYILMSDPGHHPLRSPASDGGGPFRRLIDIDHRIPVLSVHHGLLRLMRHIAPPA